MCALTATQSWRPWLHAPVLTPLPHLPLTSPSRFLHPCQCGAVKLSISRALVVFLGIVYLYLSIHIKIYIYIYIHSHSPRVIYLEWPRVTYLKWLNTFRLLFLIFLQCLRSHLRNFLENIKWLRLSLGDRRNDHGHRRRLGYYYGDLAPTSSSQGANLANTMAQIKSDLATTIAPTWSKEPPPPRGVSYLLCHKFPHPEPCLRGPPSKDLYQVLRGGFSYTRFLMWEHSK